MATDWNYYDKFEVLIDKYMPPSGEGETKASQIVTAINKLVYKWYNDGDVFDNTHYLEGWANDLSDYANWLYYYTSKEVQTILNKIEDCENNSEYEDLLQELADKLLNEEYLKEKSKQEKMFTIYDCDGKFKYEEETKEDYY